MVPRRPGQFLAERINERVINGFKVLAVGVPFVILGFVWWPFSFVSLFPMGYLVYQQGRGRSLDCANDERGLEGERRVGWLLDSLAPEVLALHDLDIRWGNADHVAIAPIGVFAIETKNLKGRFSERHGHLMHNGYRVDKTTKQVVRSACLVHDILVAADIHRFVQGVLVSMEASVTADGFEVGKAKIVPLGRLEQLLSTGRRRLTEHEQARIRAALLRNGAPFEITNVSME